MTARGVGVDCVRFVVAALDFLHGYDAARLPQVPLLPHAASSHRGDLTRRVVQFVVTRYPTRAIRCHRRRPDEDLQPADLVAVKSGDEVHAHGLIVGPDPRYLWHSCNSRGSDHNGGVVYSGCGWAIDRGIIGVWRPLEAATWK